MVIDGILINIDSWTGFCLGVVNVVLVALLTTINLLIIVFATEYIFYSVLISAAFFLYSVFEKKSYKHFKIDAEIVEEVLGEREDEPTNGGLASLVVVAVFLFSVCYFMGFDNVVIALKGEF